MRAAWYEKQGPAREVLKIGEMADPTPGPGEVRIRMVASGINPGDVKKRQNAFGYGMPYTRVIPHSDGAGHVDLVGEGVSADWVSQRVWCYGAQSYRPFGTAAEYTVVPVEQAVPLPEGVAFEQGACLGIPGITAHRCVHAAGPLEGRNVLVQGGAGAVGLCAVQLARRAGASVEERARSGSALGAKEDETRRFRAQCESRRHSHRRFRAGRGARPAHRDHARGATRNQGRAGAIALGRHSMGGRAWACLAHREQALDGFEFERMGE